MDVVGNLADHFRQIFSLGGQSPCSIDDFVTFESGHLAEAFAAFNPKSVLSDKSLDARMEKAHSLSAFGDEPSGHQALFAPSRNGLGRDVEALAEFFDRVNRFRGFFKPQIHRVGDVFDEKAQIMKSILTLDQPHRVRVGADFCYTVEQEVERILLDRIQFRQEFLGAVGLLAPLVPGRKTDLLISQFLPYQQTRNQYKTRSSVAGLTGQAPLVGTKRSPSIGSTPWGPDWFANSTFKEMKTGSCKCRTKKTKFPTEAVF
jgi:hypothetical protein